jgi:hypothetical protein
MVAKILSLPSVSGDMLILLGWAMFYLHGLWPDDTRELMQNIADKKIGFEKQMYPWRSEDPLLKARWYPARVLQYRWRKVVVTQLYDYFVASCFENASIKVINTAEKGLQVMSNSRFGTTLKYAFGSNNPGILIHLRKSLHKDLVKMGFDSIYHVSKDANNTVKDELFALLGVQSLISHDDDACGRLMHIEDSGRSLLLEWQGEQFQHFEPGRFNIGEPSMTVWTPMKVTQQTLPDGKLTPEEIGDQADPSERYFSADYDHEPDVVRYWVRYVTRGTFIKDLTKRVFNFNEEFVIKYADESVLGRNPNKRVREN